MKRNPLASRDAPICSADTERTGRCRRDDPPSAGIRRGRAAALSAIAIGVVTAIGTLHAQRPSPLFGRAGGEAVAVDRSFFGLRPRAIERDPEDMARLFAELEEPFERALRTLVERQAEDGSYADGDAERSVLATAAVTLVLLADGSTPTSGRFGRPLHRSVGWLVTRQRSDGSVAEGGEQAADLRSHGVAACALVDAVAWGGYSVLAVHARSAVGWAAKHASEDPWCEVAVAYARATGLVRRRADTQSPSRAGPARIASAMLAAHLHAYADAPSAKRRRGAGARPYDEELVASTQELLRGDVDPALAALAALGLYQRGGNPWFQARRSIYAWAHAGEDGSRQISGAGDSAAVVALAFRLLSLEAPCWVGRL